MWNDKKDNERVLFLVMSASNQEKIVSGRVS